MDPNPIELDVAGWVNSEPVTLADLRGRVVLIEVFQMLCPGCVSHGIPLAKQVQRAFRPTDVAVLGLHSVFEHHDVMGPDALAAFVSEYRITFPVAIDRPIPGRSIPATMGELQLQGTPTTLLLDRAGRLRHSILGAIDELTLGVHLGRLLAEPTETVEARPADASKSTGTPAPSGVPTGPTDPIGVTGSTCGPDGCD